MAKTRSGKTDFELAKSLITNRKLKVFHIMVKLSMQLNAWHEEHLQQIVCDQSLVRICQYKYISWYV